MRVSSGLAATVGGAHAVQDAGVIRAGAAHCYRSNPPPPPRKHVNSQIPRQHMVMIRSPQKPSGLRASEDSRTLREICHAYQDTAERSDIG